MTETREYHPAPVVVEIMDPQEEHLRDETLRMSDKVILLEGKPHGNVAYVDHNGVWATYSYCWSWNTFLLDDQWRAVTKEAEKRLISRDGSKTASICSYNHPSPEAAVKDFIQRIEVAYTNVVVRSHCPLEPAERMEWEWASEGHEEDGYLGLLYRGTIVAKITANPSEAEWVFSTVNYEPGIRMTGIDDEAKAKTIAEAWIRYHLHHPPLPKWYER